VNAQLEKRRVAVESLWAEGMSQRAIAHSMGVSVRTVQRDIDAIRMTLATEERRTTASQRIDKHLAALRALKSRNYLPDQAKDPEQIRPRQMAHSCCRRASSAPRCTWACSLIA
jgi:hypothetical protein